jgi:hypothetical protein
LIAIENKFAYPNKHRAENFRRDVVQGRPLETDGQFRRGLPSLLLIFNAIIERLCPLAGVGR